MKPVLLVIDLQKVYYDWFPSQQEHVGKAMEYTNWAIHMFREKSLPIVQVLHVDPMLKVMPGEPGFEMHPRVQLSATDHVIHKHHGNAFKDTELDNLLKKLGVDTVILSGASAEQCVLATYHGALNLDYRPVMLSEAIVSYSAGKAEFVREICTTMSIGVLPLLLESVGQ